MPAGFKARREWFERFADRVEAGEQPMPPRGLKYPCACCGYPTLEGMPYEICVLCWWENNGQDDPYAHEVWEGTNHGYSLAEARANFERALTMFAPERDPRFPGVENERAHAAKRALIDTFERLMEAGPPASDALWREVDHQERILDAELDKTLRARDRQQRKG
jgi:hypothetical protein